MNQDKIVTQELGTKLKASIISAHPEARLDQPLWAINWFDLKRAWLYELYNQIVISHVRNIGAYPIFKGKLCKVILENERLKRDMLLIVKYPKASAFLALIANKLFQVKSILRTSSVKHFQLGFMEKLNSEDQKPSHSKYTGKLKYLVHVCEGGTKSDIQSLLDFAASLEVFPYFIGSKSALIGIQKEDKKLKTFDFILNHVLVFSSYDNEGLESFVETDLYQQFIHNNKSNFAGLYERKI